ncbi:4'-phosphopantetheinyl transferase superfamily protein [Plantibacter sp. VKM Ac-2880]|uniref:4'-phosphopantetheinyl transferase family protein n=1 Tax=Plantibacter sp. VKM Ac-2880 TaxID=2783827 RepID=UPI00188F773E|nr:4'-phosphopantetheinyl transferase superfamily protein [Plantibacter sp. VKM Ac-2880]MBF4569719.1 4'-phosphopantetheinyl transferase superfamily protein [Plantibacter sp. VKM Ac-2880]
MSRPSRHPQPAVRLLSWDRADELDLDGTAGRLDEAARDRLEASSEAEARRFLFGRALLVDTVAKTVGARRITVTAHCPHCGLAHGRPQVLVDGGTVHASVSHTDGASAVAVSVTHAVGVDVERLDAARFAGVETVALSPTERERWHRLPEQRRLRSLAEQWTAKEAVTKALGTGLATDPATIDLTGRAEFTGHAGGTVAEIGGRRFVVDHPVLAPDTVVATALLLA